jgi:hypothetical protein
MADEKTVSFEEHSRIVQDLQKATDRAQRMEAKLTDLERSFEKVKDIDPLKYKAVLEDYDLMRKEQAKGDPAKIDELVKEKEARIRAEVQKEIDELRGKSGKYESELKELRVVDKAMNEIGGAFNDDMHPFIKQYIRSQVDLGNDGLIIKDDKGETRYSRADRTKPMSLREFADEIAEKHPSAAKSKAVAGSMQAGTKSNGSGGMDGARWNAMTEAQRAAYPLEDRRKYSAMAVGMTLKERPQPAAK